MGHIESVHVQLVVLHLYHPHWEDWPLRNLIQLALSIHQASVPGLVQIPKPMDNWIRESGHQILFSGHASRYFEGLRGCMQPPCPSKGLQSLLGHIHFSLNQKCASEAGFLKACYWHNKPLAKWEITQQIKHLLQTHHQLYPVIQKISFQNFILQPL